MFTSASSGSLVESVCVDESLFRRGSGSRERRKSFIRDVWRRVVISLRFVHRLVRSGQRQRQRHRWGLIAAVLRFRMKLLEAKERVQTINVPVLPRNTNTQMSDFTLGSSLSLMDTTTNHVDTNSSNFNSFPNVKSPFNSLSPASRKKRKGATPLSAYYVDNEGHLVKERKRGLIEHFSPAILRRTAPNSPTFADRSSGFITPFPFGTASRGAKVEPAKPEGIPSASLSVTKQLAFQPEAEPMGRKRSAPSTVTLLTPRTAARVLALLLLSLFVIFAVYFWYKNREIDQKFLYLYEDHKNRSS